MTRPNQYRLPACPRCGMPERRIRPLHSRGVTFLAWLRRAAV
jgi:hypothetical protein